jgi:hypothetical protein
MQYMLLLYSDEKAWESFSPADQEAGLKQYFAYGDALRKAGVYVSSDRLRDTADATTVTLVNGKTQVMDGPYTETKEQLGGFYIIEAKTLDEAITWAARCPGAGHGHVEIRPIWPMG